MSDVAIHHSDATGRYDLFVDGVLAAYAEVSRRGAVAEMPHTETLPAFRGRGLAAQVVRFALDDLAAQGCTVVPSCWFVAEFINANPAYRTLLA